MITESTRMQFRVSIPFRILAGILGALFVLLGMMLLVTLAVVLPGQGISGGLVLMGVMAVLWVPLGMRLIAAARTGRDTLQGDVAERGTQAYRALERWARRRGMRRNGIGPGR